MFYSNTKTLYGVCPVLNIGKCRLPDLLARRGWTQRDLAERCKLTPSQISDYATGRRVMSLARANLIAGVLRCRIEDLYDGLGNWRGIE